MKLLFYITLLMAAFSGCKKPEELRETYYIDKELYDYVLFPKGSWWIYKEETSGVEDSVVITKKEQYINKVRIAADYDFEVYDVDIYSSQRGNGSGGGDAAYKGTHGDCLYIENYNSDTQGVPFYKYISSRDKGDTVNVIQGVAITKLDTMGFYSSNGNMFFDVVVFEYLRIDDLVKKKYTALNRYYFSKNIGLIREEDCVNNKTWNITSYSIK